MQSFYVFSTLLVVAIAQEYEIVNPHEIATYPEWYTSRGHQQPRFRRDLEVDRKVGDGRVYGKIGENDNGLFGKAGYERTIFNDHRGKLDGEAYGSRVLGPNGDSSHVGGALNWQNSNAAASLDVSRRIHGGSSVNAAAGGKWPVGKNGDISAQGFYERAPGRSDHGGRAVFNYRW